MVNYKSKSSKKKGYKVLQSDSDNEECLNKKQFGADKLNKNYLGYDGNSSEISSDKAQNQKKY